MNKNFSYPIILILLFSCSFNSNSKFWTSSENIKYETAKKIIFEEKENFSNEFNPNFKITLPKNILARSNDLLNNDGFVDFSGNLQKISKFRYSKIKSFKNYEPEILIAKNDLIYFDSSGSILKFDQDSNLLWKKNFYSKRDKKLQPVLFFDSQGEYLFVADTIANYYLINKNNASILWKKRNSSSFNSQVRIYSDKAFVIDLENKLKCISLKNGELLWTVNTENSVIRSTKKQSLIIHQNKIFFNNSIGDITAVDVESGDIIWQTPTQSSLLYRDILSLKLSDLVSDGKSIYFSNNNNQFFSIDINVGSINWEQKLSSELRPALVGEYIVTITDDGLLAIIEKKNGNILRINNLFKDIKKKRIPDFKPTGFIVGRQHVYLTTSNGILFTVDFRNGKIINKVRLDRNKLQRPIYLNRSIYIAKENSIIKLN